MTDGPDVLAAVGATMVMGETIGGGAMTKHRDLSALARGLHDLVLAPPLAEPARADDEAHAGGHRHLGPPPAVPTPRSVRRAGPRGDRTGHPGRQH